MKLTLALTILAYNTISADGDCTFDSGTTFDVAGCNFEAVSAATGCTAAELQAKLGLGSEEDVEGKIYELCADALTDDEVDEYGYAGFPFERVMAKGYIWDTNFFNGGTAYNTMESDTTVADHGIRIQAVKDTVVGSTIIGFPDERIPNFQNCEKNAAMCCYVSMKNDGGSEGDPTDASDICHHDMSQSQRAARTEAGFAYYGNHYDEGNSYCEGFAWDDDVDGPYKGNTLFHVAMDKGFLQNHYTRAVPGAPMCACIEQMPVVSNVKCTETTVAQKFKVNGSDADTSLELVENDISFGDCGDFAEHYSAKFPGDSISDYVVDTCPDVPPFIEELGYTARDNNWTPLYGKGLMSYGRVDEDTARSLVNNDGTDLKIIKRRCLDCKATHVDIYYKRLTPIPDYVDIMDILLANWDDDTGNVFHTDFELYSTYQDAIDDKDPWTHCNFMDPGIGFPRDCGPTKKIGSQWNSLTRGGKHDVMFLVEK